MIDPDRLERRSGELSRIAGRGTSVSRLGLSADEVTEAMDQSTKPTLADDVIARLRAHEAELRAAGIKRLSLFGSVARGEAGPDSDAAACSASESRNLSNVRSLARTSAASRPCTAS